MAKKAARDKQQGLPGIVNKPTKAIEKKAQEYADALYERMTLQESRKIKVKKIGEEEE
jgi:dihydroneopterin aldolase